MGWDLVSKTDSGYKKYRDQWGNFRYLDPSGNFTNSQAWAGTQSHGATEIGAQEQTPGYHATDIEEQIRDDLENYTKMVDHVIDEPLEHYIPPIDSSQLAGKGYPITDYPYEKRIDKLEEIMNDNPGFEAYTIGVYTMVTDGQGTITSSGYRFCTHQDSFDILAGEFRRIMDELRALLADYGDVIITETVIKTIVY